jgi:hypothetical protein
MALDYKRNTTNKQKFLNKDLLYFYFECFCGFTFLKDIFDIAQSFCFLLRLFTFLLALVLLEHNKMNHAVISLLHINVLFRYALIYYLTDSWLDYFHINIDIFHTQLIF